MQNLFAGVERWDNPLPKIQGLSGTKVGFQHVPDLDGFVACMSDGDIGIIRGDALAEVVGAVDGGIAGSAWSPDYELLSIVSKTGNLLFLSNSFDPIGEVELDQGKPVDSASLSWRGDGAFVAVLLQRGSECSLRTWDRSGNPVSPVIAVPLAAAAVAFQPSGVFIALAAPTGIALHELNGQSRGSIATKVPPRQLAWDASSDALCALCGPEVAVFSLSNGRWYKRWSLIDTDVSDVGWDPSVPLKLRVVLGDGSVRSLSFVWDFVCGDYQHTAVVRDGDTLLVTAFDRAIIPPPMSAAAITHPESLSLHAVSRTRARIAALGAQTGALYLCDLATPQPHPAAQLGPAAARAARQMVFAGDDHIALLAWRRESNTDTLSVVRLSDGSVINVSVPLVLRVLPGLGDDVIVMGADGAVTRLSVGGATERLFALPAPCAFGVMCAASQATAALSQGGRPVLLALSTKGRLFADAALVADNVRKLAQPLAPSLESRVVETGAVVVAAITQARCVLQMPRGNLETVVPRAVLLSAVKQLLDAGDYKQAWLSVRRQRLDPNLLYDHNPAVFAATVDRLVTELPEDALAAVLVQARDDDVTYTLYAHTYQRSEPYDPRRCAGKVNRLSEMVLKAVASLSDPLAYTMTILTARFVHRPAQLEEALLYINSIRAVLNLVAPTDNESQGRRVPVSSDRAIKYALVMVDQEELWRAALGTYNLELALWVSQHIQKDPREVVPMLNALDAMPVFLRQYQIDMQLGRWARALQSLYSGGADQWDGVVRLMRDKSLYLEALALVSGDRVAETTVRRLYGEHLFSMRRFEEAGQMFMLSAEYSRAADAYREAADWRMALAAAGAAGLDTVATVAALAETLVSMGRLADAGRVYEQFGGDVSAALRCYIDAAAWRDAMRSAYNVAGQQRAVATSDVLAAVIDAGVLATERWRVRTEELQKMRARLVQVRTLKTAQAQFAGAAGDAAAADLDADSFSQLDDTASVATGLSSLSGMSGASGRSQKSGRSARARRKAEKRRHIPHEGSPFEEAALIKQLSAAVPTQEQVAELSELLWALATLDQLTAARTLQTTFDALLAEAQDAVTDARTAAALATTEGTQTHHAGAAAAGVAASAGATTVTDSWRIKWL